MMLNTEIVSFESYSDASGAPAIVEVRSGRQSARFACDYLGRVTCNGLGSGLTARMTARAADAAKRLYQARVNELGAEWLAANTAMYTE